jgi:hypothetical protein
MIEFLAAIGALTCAFFVTVAILAALWRYDTCKMQKEHERWSKDRDTQGKKKGD